MAFTLQTAQALSGVTSSLLGTGLQVFGAIQTRKASDSLLRAARDEAMAALEEGEVISQTATQNAYANLFDIASLEEQTEANIAFIKRQGTSLESAIMASVAASGIELSGSPLLAVGHAALETARAVANEEFNETTGKRQLLFQVEQDLLTAKLAQRAAKRGAESIVKTGKREAGLLRKQSTAQMVGAAQTFTQTVSNPAFTSLLKGEI